MGRVKILEFKVDEKDFISNSIGKFTGTGFSHTEMIIDNYKYSVSSGENFLYGKKEIDPNNINIKRVIVIDLDHNFTEQNIQKMKNWWESEISLNRSYGFKRLILFPITIVLIPFYRLYYKITKKVWKPLFTEILKYEKTCAEAVDYNLKIGGLDLFKDLPENVVYPGMFYLKLVARKINELKKVCVSVTRTK